MPNYKESTKSGVVTTYLAARSGRFENPYGGVPSLVFDEVERTVMDGKLLSERPTGRVLRATVGATPREIPFIDESYQQVRDESGAIVDGHSFQDAHFAYLLACVYMDAAVNADAAASSRKGPPPDVLRARLERGT